MLIDLDTMREIKAVPFQPEFDLVRRRLTDDEFDAMVARIEELIPVRAS